jgi:hypothetical protein
VLTAKASARSARVKEAIELGELEEPQKALRMKKREKRRRSLDSDSSEDELFRGAPLPGGSQKVQKLALMAPGALSLLALSKMRSYLLASGGAFAATMTHDDSLPPVVSSYLALVYFPSHPESKVGLRMSREMKTLGMIADHVLSGRLCEAMDTLLQRLKALELVNEQQTWNQARWLELLPPSDVSAWSREELREAMSEQKLDMKLGLAPSTGSGHKGGGGKGSQGQWGNQQWEDHDHEGAEGAPWKQQWRKRGRDKANKGGKDKGKGKGKETKGGKGSEAPA